MNQYCRYCSRLCSDNICELKNKQLSDSAIKHPNHCKDFAFCNIDIESGREYHPRENKKTYEKISIFSNN